MHFVWCFMAYSCPLISWHLLTHPRKAAFELQGRCVQTQRGRDPVCAHRGQRTVSTVRHFEAGSLIVLELTN